MGNRIEIHRVAAIVLAGVVLAQLAACGTTPRLEPQPLSHWSGPEDCATNYAAAVSGLAPAEDAASVLLVDSIGPAWNCTTIPEGRYDAEVVVRWSNGWRETALDAKGIDVAPGQRLIAKAHERGRGAIPASFAEIRGAPELAPESQTAQAPVGSESTPEALAAARPDQAPSSAGQTVPESPHPAVTALKIAGTVVLVAAVVVLSRGHIVPSFRRGGADAYGPAAHGPRRTGPSSRPSADCCFVWIEDGATGAVVAGSRPVQN